MGPQSRVRCGAWVVMLALLVAVPAFAQFYEDTRRALDLTPDPAARSPRVLSMGRLAYVIDDVHSRVDLWEFTQNPAGLIDSDSSSTLEFYPGTAAASRARDDRSGTPGREQQEFAYREVRLGYEGWLRSTGQTAFGLIGEFGRLRTDVPQTAFSEHRAQFTAPNTRLAIAGKIPGLDPERFRYGASIRHRYQSNQDEYRAVVSNAAGDFIDKDGTTLLPPDELTPDEHGIRSLGGDLGVSARLMSWLELAGRAAYSANSIEGRNDGPRHSSEIIEDRPYRTLGATALGRWAAGRGAYAADWEAWRTGHTDERWFVTLSRGTGQTPIQGRGAYRTRDERGNELRTRLEWTQGRLTLGAGARRYERKIRYTPPRDDAESFNAFLRMLASRPEVDSLTLPDSVIAERITETTTDVGGGASYRLPWRRAVIGAEVHQTRGKQERVVAGEGPKPESWDVRVGAEAAFGPAVVLRAGYDYESQDQDALTELNEYITQAVTAGFAIHPAVTAWTIEMGYGVSWSRADFGDPSRIRATGQQGVFRVRWAF